MTNEFEAAIRAKIDEHGRQLTEHGESIEGLALVVMGNTEMQVRGLLQRTHDLEELTKEVKAWRTSMGVYWNVALFYARIIVSLLGLLGLAAYRPALEAIVEILAGG